MKVIFLDIEGVLNTKETYERIRRQQGYSIMLDTEIDEFRLAYLKEIIDKTEAKIVLSSSFRYFFTKENDKVIPTSLKSKKIYDKFLKYGIEIYDTTPITHDLRENQIINWLSNRDDIDDFIIIDDDPNNFKDLFDKLIQTSTIKRNDMLSFMRESFGLCEQHIEEIVKRLGLKEKVLKK